MKAYKGFDKNLQCRGYQYKIGGEYREDSAELCSKGFHACEYPLDCFGYYTPAESRYCEVEIDDNGQRNDDDTKVCGASIKIGAEIGINELIEAATEYIKSHCTNEEMGADKAALTGGYRSALTGGNRSALTGGNMSVVYGGEGAKVRGGMHAVLALQYWVGGALVGVKVKVVDGVKIKPDTWYRLDKAGRFMEVKE